MNKQIRKSPFAELAKTKETATCGYHVYEQHSICPNCQNEMAVIKSCNIPTFVCYKCRVNLPMPE